MRIEQIHVDGFGRISDFPMEPSDGLTLVRGLNEAGKSTLLAFTRAILFGFEQAYPALAGGKRGGRLKVRMADGSRFTIERHGDRGGQGTLKVYDEGGVERPGKLAELLLHVDRALYTNVFAFGLGELASFEKLKGEEVAARIYGAGLGIGSADPVKIEAAFEKAASDLFVSSGQKPPINDILINLEQVDRILAARNLPKEYDDAKDALRLAESERDALVGRVASHDAALARVARLKTCWRAWQGLQDAESCRAQMGDVVLLPSDLGERLALAERGRDDTAAVEARGRLAVEESAAALQAIVVDDAVLEHRIELDALADAAVVDKGRAERIADAHGRLAVAEATLERTVRRLGSGWDAARIAAFDASIPVESELNGRWRESLARTSQQLAAAETAHAAARQGNDAVVSDLARAREQHAELADAEGMPGADELERRLRGVDAAATSRENLAGAAARAKTAADLAGQDVPPSPAGRPWAEVAEIAADLAQAIRDEASGRATLATLAPALGAEGAPVPKRSAMPYWAIGLVGLVVALLFAIIGQPLAGLIALAAGLGLAGQAWWSARRAGATGTGGSAAQAYAAAEQAVGDAIARRASLAAKLDLSADATGTQVQELQARAASGLRAEAAFAAATIAADRAAAEAAAAGDELAAVAAAAGLPAAPTAADREAFARQVAEARGRAGRRDGLQAQIDTLTATLRSREDLLGRAVEALDAARANSATVDREWAAWLEDHDLAGISDRETAANQLKAVADAKAELATVEQLTAEIAALERAHAAFADEAMAIGSALGRWSADSGRADGDGLVRLVGSLADANAAARAADARRAAANEALAAAERSHAQAAQELGVAVAALEALVAEVGAVDADGVRAALARSAEAHGHDERIRTATEVLVAQSGAGDALTALRADLAGYADLGEIEMAGAAEDAARASTKLELDQVSERIGGLKRSVDQMLRDASPSVERQRREDLLGRLDEKARDWAAYSVARHLLQTSRRKYEGAHRPAVISIAERYFADWTEGRYTRILAPIGSTSLIDGVERADGTVVRLDGLSMGTAQQLYLAVRFGLVEHFAENAQPLPVVMDDILVNFDPIRAKRTAASIKELSQRHQVIYFTCHEEVHLEPDKELTLERL